MKAKKMDSFTAVGIAEGLIESDSFEQTLSAWATIAHTGIHRSLQGFFGRTLEAIVEQGLVDWEGNIFPEKANTIRYKQ